MAVEKLMIRRQEIVDTDTISARDTLVIVFLATSTVFLITLGVMVKFGVL